MGPAHPKLAENWYLCMSDGLEGLIAELEGRFPVGEAGDCRTSATGEHFVEFHAGGCRNDPATGTGPGAVWCERPETAVALLRLQILDYAAGRSGVLYWRIQPDICGTDIRVPELQPFGGNNAKVMHVKRTVWLAYARLLISDKPVLEKAS